LECQKQGKIDDFSVRGWRKKCENDSKFDTSKRGERIAPGIAMANWFLVATALLTASGAAGAADLSAIQRKIAKEPEYAGKPKYCLLVFGPDAKTRIWLALDGDKLYVDRNGNGDLTDDGPPLAAKVDGDFRRFNVPQIRDGPRFHKHLSVEIFPMRLLARSNSDAREFVSKHPNSLAFRLGVNLDLPGRTGAAADGRVEQLTYPNDVNGFIQFSETAGNAPIIHFGGPWSILLSEKGDLLIGREADFYAAAGTPGLGAGTTAFIEYEKLIPTELRPIVEISYPPKLTGGPPVRESFELKERC